MTRTLKVAVALFPLALAITAPEVGAQPADPYADEAPLPAEPAPAPAPAKSPSKSNGTPSAKKPTPPAPADAQRGSLDPLDPYADPPPAPPTSPARPTKPVTSAPTPPLATPAAKEVPAEPAAKKRPVAAIPERVAISDLVAVQGLLAVQRLDGWLLYDRAGENPISVRLVKPEGTPTRAWFYLLPAKGEPVALVHSSEVASFQHLAGKKLTYAGYRDLDKQLRAMLKGLRTVAAEYSAKGAVPGASRVDAGTIERIRATGVQVRSSDTLVQFTKAMWGDAGRTAHYVAVHHLAELRKDALAFIAKAVQNGQVITEYDVQQRLLRGMTIRGLVAAPPAVAAGANTADPFYVPTAAKSAPIRRGDVIVLSMAAKLDKPEGIWAAQTWVAIADATVPERIAKAFETASLARDQSLALIADRARKRRPITGAEVDDAARAFFKKAGVADRVMHRTGHSIDDELQGAGAHLDNYESKDTRILTPGTGVTIGPGLYVAGDFGVRTEISVFLAPSGPEVTTPAQDEIEVLLAP